MARECADSAFNKLLTAEAPFPLLMNQTILRAVDRQPLTVLTMLDVAQKQPIFFRVTLRSFTGQSI